jgi:ATP-dependent exoDNAse (exonuclease V) alpha subunit
VKWVTWRTARRDSHRALRLDLLSWRQGHAGSRTTTTRRSSTGDLGVVLRIDMEEGELAVDFDGREITYGFGELDELVLAYATTIHKSQGSEYPAVVIPLSTQHYPMLQRNLVYTGVTRGKRLVVLVGQRKALAIAVKGARTRKRWSKLRDCLARGGGPSRTVSDAPNPVFRIERSDH